MPKMMRLQHKAVAEPPFAPPFLRAGKLLIAQTANILLYLGGRHGLAPKNEAGRLFVHQLQLTIADAVAEAHDAHHPVASSLYYEDQKREAKRAAHHFAKERVPKYLGYFESVLARSRGLYLLGNRVSYADLSLFQLVEGLRYAFPVERVETVRDRRLRNVHRYQGCAFPTISLQIAASLSTKTASCHYPPTGQ